jgi:hypothetical protein
MSKSESGRINRLIEKAILDAEKMGAKVLSLGLINQVSLSYVVIRNILFFNN